MVKAWTNDATSHYNLGLRAGHRREAGRGAAQPAPLRGVRVRGHRPHAQGPGPGRPARPERVQGPAEGRGAARAARTNAPARASVRLAPFVVSNGVAWVTALEHGLGRRGRHVPRLLRLPGQARPVPTRHRRARGCSANWCASGTPTAPRPATGATSTTTATPAIPRNRGRIPPNHAHPIRRGSNPAAPRATGLQSLFF